MPAIAHRVRRQHWRIRGAFDREAFSVLKGFRLFLEQHLQAIILEEFDAVSSGAERIHLDLLSIQLRITAPQSWDDLPGVLRNELRTTLRSQLARLRPRTTTLPRSTDDLPNSPASSFISLLQYLRTGSVSSAPKNTSDRSLTRGDLELVALGHRVLLLQHLSAHNESPDFHLRLFHLFSLAEATAFGSELANETVRRIWHSLRDVVTNFQKTEGALGRWAASRPRSSNDECPESSATGSEGDAGDQLNTGKPRGDVSTVLQEFDHDLVRAETGLTHGRRSMRGGSNDPMSRSPDARDQAFPLFHPLDERQTDTDPPDHAWNELLNYLRTGLTEWYHVHDDDCVTFGYLQQTATFHRALLCQRLCVIAEPPEYYFRLIQLIGTSELHSMLVEVSTLWPTEVVRIRAQLAERLLKLGSAFFGTAADWAVVASVLASAAMIAEQGLEDAKPAEPFPPRTAASPRGAMPAVTNDSPASEPTTLSASETPIAQATTATAFPDTEGKISDATKPRDSERNTEVDAALKRCASDPLEPFAKARPNSFEPEPDGSSFDPKLSSVVGALRSFIATGSCAPEAAVVIEEALTTAGAELVRYVTSQEDPARTLYALLTLSSPAANGTILKLLSAQDPLRFNPHLSGIADRLLSGDHGFVSTETRGRLLTLLFFPEAKIDVLLKTPSLAPEPNKSAETETQKETAPDDVTTPTDHRSGATVNLAPISTTSATVRTLPLISLSAATRHSSATTSAPDQPWSVKNAGLVLLHPYFSRYFEITGVREKNRPEWDPAALPRAACLLQLLATGNSAVNEFSLTFVKVLLGMQPEAPLCVHPDLLASDDVAQADQLLRTAITHWSALKKTSIDGFRQAYLQRPGLLHSEAGSWRLRIERRGHDVLLDYLPWTIGFVKLPWMRQPIQTEW